MPHVIYQTWNDSSHIIAKKYIKKFLTDNEEKLENYESEFTHTFGKNNFKRGSKKEKSYQEIVLFDIYKKSLELKNADRFDFIKSELKKIEINTFSDEFIFNFIKQQKKLLFCRLDRFRKKALNNEWNYFVTITYDDKKHDELSFKEKLKKCLANLHDQGRGGYRYMGVFERSQSGRLHFHGLFYIPKGQLKGEIKEINDYSTEDRKMRTAHVNTFFEERFGRNDFIKINTNKLMRDNTINYLLKYISKSDEPIFYGRDISTFKYVELNDEEIICCFGNIIKKYVLFDDVLKDKEIIHMRC